MQANHKMTVAALALSFLGLMVSGIGTGFAQNMVPSERGHRDHHPTTLVSIVTVGQTPARAASASTRSAPAPRWSLTCSKVRLTYRELRHRHKNPLCSSARMSRASVPRRCALLSDLWEPRGAV